MYKVVFLVRCSRGLDEVLSVNQLLYIIMPKYIILATALAVHCFQVRKLLGDESLKFRNQRSSAALLRAANPSQIIQ